MKQLADLTLPGGEKVVGPTGIPTGGISSNPFATGNTIISNSISLLLIFAVILSLIYLILGGIRWITSGGDPKGVEAARKQVTYAVIGLIVAFLAFAIINAVGLVLGTSKLVSF